MPLVFTATVCRKRDLFVIDSTVSVYQQVAGNPDVQIAYIVDSADPADHRKTNIKFAGGVLNFLAAYDGPLYEHITRTFLDEKYQDTDISIHHFPWINKSFLCSSEGFFPIIEDRNRDTFNMRIYQSSPIPRENGLLYSVLATVIQTKRFQNGFEYKIQVEEPVPIPLLMAIFSLPFTLLNI